MGIAGLYYPVVETVVHTAHCIGFVVLETGGPYCLVYNFLCRGNCGSKFLYQGSGGYTILYISFSVMGMVVYTSYIGTSVMGTVVDSVL